LRTLLLVVVVMFGFGYLMVPLYEKFCEVTGINFLTKADGSQDRVVRNTQVDTSRQITVVFDANINGPWRFRPVQSTMQVHPGELATITYEVANQQPRRMHGQAIPSYMPLVAGRYFIKMECFCFQQQD